jgi:hypothetical protein
MAALRQGHVPEGQLKRAHRFRRWEKPEGVMGKTIGFLFLMGALAASAMGGGHLYWTLQGESRIYHVDLGGDGAEIQSVEQNGNSLGLAVDSEQRQVYWGMEDREQMRRLIEANSNGRSYERTCPNGVNGKQLMDFGRILRAGFDLSEPQTVFSTGKTTIRLDVDNYIAVGDETPTTIAVDPEGEKIYWGEFSGWRIRRSNLDGSCAETLIEKGTCGQPLCITLDVPGKSMYWTMVRGEIRRSNLDGSEMRVLAQGEAPHGIAVDSTGAKLYWSDRGRVIRSDLEGKSQTPLEFRVWSGYGGPLALDSANEEIYWEDHEEHRILRCNLQRMEMEVVVPHTGGYLWAIAVSPE